MAVEKTSGVVRKSVASKPASEPAVGSTENPLNSAPAELETEMSDTQETPKVALVLAKLHNYSHMKLGAFTTGKVYWKEEVDSQVLLGLEDHNEEPIFRRAKPKEINAFEQVADTGAADATGSKDLSTADLSGTNI